MVEEQSLAVWKNNSYLSLIARNKYPNAGNQKPKQYLDQQSNMIDNGCSRPKVLPMCKK